MIQIIQKLQQQLDNKLKHIAQQLVNNLDMYYFFNYVTKNNDFYNDYITITYNLIKLANLVQNTHINSTCIANAMYNAIYYSLINYTDDNRFRLKFFSKHNIKIEAERLTLRKARITLHLTKHLNISILFRTDIDKKYFYASVNFKKLNINLKRNVEYNIHTLKAIKYINTLLYYYANHKTDIKKYVDIKLMLAKDLAKNQAKYINTDKNFAEIKN